MDAAATVRNPRDLSSEEWPSPSKRESEEFRATKKVKHREDVVPGSDYRDKLLAGTEMEVTMEELANEKEVRVEPGDVEIDRSGLVPEIRLSTGLKEKLTQNMHYSIVVNLLGRLIRYKALCLKLRQIWNMQGTKVVDMGCGYFLVQFLKKGDYLEAVLEGSWLVSGSYLQVQDWTPKFRVHHTAPQSTTVWIRISELPPHLCPSNVISAIGEAVGKVIRVDYNTSGLQRGKFARIAVNIDLKQPLVSKFTIDGEEFKVEYENLSELCIFCGMYGHLDANCARKPTNKEGEDMDNNSDKVVEIPKDTYGPWMIVEKKRKQMKRIWENGGKESIGQGGSRFDILQDEGPSQEKGREDSLNVSTNPINFRDNSGWQGKARKDKSALVVNDENTTDSTKRMVTKNIKPPKSTIGEFIEYRQRQLLKEVESKQPTTLAPSTDIAAPAEVREPRDTGTQQLSMVDGALTDPEANKQGMQVMGIPPDKTGTGLEDHDAMELETSGGSMGVCHSSRKHDRC